MANFITALFIVVVMFLPGTSPAFGGAINVLTKEYLLNNEWGPDLADLGLYFKFAPDNTFKTGSNYEGGDYYIGTYEITDNKLILKISKAGDSGRDLIGTTLAYTLTYDKAATYFDTFLDLENSTNYQDRTIKKLWNHKSVVKNGQKRIFQKIKVVTINDLAEIKETTVYHQFPREDSNRFMFSIFDDKNLKESDWSLTIPADYLHQPFLNGKIRLIFRTLEKDNKNRYWYCIDLPVGNGGYDRLKLEGSDKEWNKRSIGWIKQTDVVKINPRE